MLWFNHPKEVGSRKLAAMLAQRRKPASLSLDVPLSDLPTVHIGDPIPAAPAALNFSVRYSLPEYVCFMWQHAGYLIRRRRIGFFSTYYLLARSTAAAALHFVALGRSRHTYEFTIDEHGIVRSSVKGVTLIGWQDVIAIRPYSRGYLMVLKRGTLPLPFRCLDGEQAGAILRFAEWHKGRASAASR